MGTRVLATSSSLPSSPAPDARGRLWASSRAHVGFGLAWVAAAAVVELLPALLHGSHLGPFNLLSQYGLSKAPTTGVLRHTNSDQIDEIIPWTSLVWSQVHQGHLPLWNPSSALGMPLAFNWQSAPLSVGALVGYLVPQSAAYTVGVLVTLLIAGTGAFVFARVLGIGVLGATVAGVVFEIGGPFVGWLGWPLSAVMAWAGWLFAAGVLVVRGRRRWRAITLYAVVLAFAVFAGQPESLLVLVGALVVFVAVQGTARRGRAGAPGAVGAGGARSMMGGVATPPAPAGWRARSRPALDLVLATLAGLALSAPFWLPGLQLATLAVRNQSKGSKPLPISHLLYTVGGNPISGANFYYETSAYVGVIALALAVVAGARRRNRAAVIGLAVVTVLLVALAFFPPVVSFMDSLPLVGKVWWSVALMPMEFVVALLAGAGADALATAWRRPRVRRWAWAGLALAALVDLGQYVDAALSSGPSPVFDAFILPVASVAVGAIVLAALERRARGANPAAPSTLALGPGRVAVSVLLLAETVFLLIGAAPLWSSSDGAFAATPAITTLQREVGSSTVGFGNSACLIGFPGVGIAPNVNVVYGVQELAVYDPIVPRAYFDSWRSATGLVGGNERLALFCPPVTSAALARRYGVAYVLEPRGGFGPAGSVSVGPVGDENLYRIPGADAATLVPASPGGMWPADDAPGADVSVDRSNPSVWRMSTDASAPQVVRLRLTDVPGWRATIDGRPLALASYDGVMLQARVPAGRHQIVVSYWPSTLTLGLVLAAVAALALTAGGGVARSRRRRAGDAVVVPASAAT